MTSPWQTDNDDTHDQQGKDPVRAQLKQLEKQNKELLDKLAAAQKTARESTIKDVLAEKKLNPKLAKLVPPDIDATPDAIATWLKDYEDLFPTAPSTDTTDSGNPDGNKPGGNDEPTDQATIDAMNAALRLAQVTTGGRSPNSKPEELLARLSDPTLTQADLLKLIESHGGGVGVG